MLLTEKEIRYILDLIAEKEGFGYSKNKEIGSLQVKLSTMLQMLNQRVNKR